MCENISEGTDGYLKDWLLKDEKMSDEEEKKSLLPVQQESSYGSVVAQLEDGDQEGRRQGDEERLFDDSEEVNAQQCWVSRHKILTAGVILTAWTCIGITVFLVLFLKVITLVKSTISFLKREEVSPSQSLVTAQQKGRS